MNLSRVVRAEFHCHSVYSPDSLVRVEDLLAACEQKNIDKLAITDHNRLEGTLRAHALDPQRVIVGEEIQTTQGEILGYFMREEIPAGLEPLEVIRRLKDQGAFISVAHPFDTNRDATHWQPGTLEAMLPFLDAFETFNARCLRQTYNAQAQVFAQEHGLAGMAGSDAHSTFELGKATMLLADFNDAMELRTALENAQWDVHLSSAAVHLFSLWAKIVKKVHKPAL
jgi:predicted metal-dependent phosphoesterase TrpH